MAFLIKDCYYWQVRLAKPRVKPSVPGALGNLSTYL